MTQPEAHVYWYPAAYNLFGSSTNALDIALGVSEYQDYIARPAELDTPMSEELKQLLIKLAGPHGQTILKAYRIQKGLE